MERAKNIQELNTDTPIKTDCAQSKWFRGRRGLQAGFSRVAALDLSHGRQAVGDLIVSDEPRSGERIFRRYAAKTGYAGEDGLYSGLLVLYRRTICESGKQ